MFLCNFDLYVRLEDLQEYADQLLNRGGSGDHMNDFSLPQSPVSSVSDEPIISIRPSFSSKSSSSSSSSSSSASMKAVVPETFMSPRQSQQNAKTSQCALMTPPQQQQTKKAAPPATATAVVVVESSVLPRKRRRTSWSNPVPQSRHTPSSWMTDTMRAGY